MRQRNVRPHALVRIATSGLQGVLRGSSLVWGVREGRGQVNIHSQLESVNQSEEVDYGNHLRLSEIQGFTIRDLYVPEKIGG